MFMKVLRLATAAPTRFLLRRDVAIRLPHVAFFSSQPVNNSNASDEGNLTMKVDITDSCVKKLRDLQRTDPGSVLRVSVESGGCSGFQYKFTLDKKINSDDKVFERDGAKVVVDIDSLPLLNGAQIDYYTELIRSAFRINQNPQSERACSCGSSFSPKI